MEVSIDIPTVVGNLANGVGPRFEQRPKVRHVRSARESTRQPDEGNGEGSAHGVTLCRHVRSYPRSPPCGPAFIRRDQASVLRSDRNSEAINLMQNKHSSNSAVDLCYMLVATPPQLAADGS
jgi:hypothetical protein